MERLNDIILEMEERINYVLALRASPNHVIPDSRLITEKLTIEKFLPRLKSIAEQQKDEVVYGEFQLCPKCNGSGLYYNYDGTSLTNICDVCNGQKIIAKPIHQPINK